MNRFKDTDPRALNDLSGENHSPTRVAPYFADEDHLRLLQLMTRRAMADRQRRTALKESDDLDTEARRVAIPALDDIPSCWRLVPEGTSLYDWQRNALPLWLPEGRGTVKIATGGGKTLFALAAAQQLQNEREPDLRVNIGPRQELQFH